MYSIGSCSFLGVHWRLFGDGRRVLSGLRHFLQNNNNGYYRKFSTPSAVPLHNAVEKFNSSLFNLMKHYEDLIGLTEVKVAQRLVLEAERDFMKTQEARREKQDEIRDVQSRLKEIHVELDKTSRGEDRYLNLLTQEHAIIKKEKQLVDDFRRLERSERDCFTLLSNRLRDSHEKERERAEKTKYGSIIGSIVCGLIGIIGGTVVNRHRLKEIKNIVQDSTEPGHFQRLLEQLGFAVEKQQQRINDFMNELNIMLSDKPFYANEGTAAGAPDAFNAKKNLTGVESGSQIDRILFALKSQDDKLAIEMNEIKRMIAAERGHQLNEGSNVVYIGPDLKALLDDTQKSLEWKIKLNTLVQVVVVYGTLALTLPLLYAWLR